MKNKTSLITAIVTCAVLVQGCSINGVFSGTEEIKQEEKEKQVEKGKYGTIEIVEAPTESTPVDRMRERYQNLPRPEWFRKKDYQYLWSEIKDDQSKPLSTKFLESGLTKEPIDNLKRKDYYEVTKNISNRKNLIVKHNKKGESRKIAIPNSKGGWSLVEKTEGSSSRTEKERRRSITNTIRLSEETKRSNLSYWDKRAVNEFIDRVKIIMNRDIAILLSHGELDIRYTYNRFNNLSTGPVKIISANGSVGTIHFNLYQILDVI